MKDLVRVIARFRVGLGFLSGIAVLVLARPTRSSILLGLPVAVAGELMRIWAAGHLNKSREVTRSGPYRFVAHPLYLGSSLIGAGLAIGAGRTVVAIIVAVYLLVTLTAAIRNEEAFLRGAFGGAYDAYKLRDDVDRERRFSWERAMANREYRAMAGVTVALLFLIARATYGSEVTAIGRLTCGAGLVAVCLLCITLQRTPLVWFDEVYFVSAAQSVANGGEGIPEIEPASSVNFPLPLLYGPVFFWLEGQIVTRFGPSPLTARMLPLTGAVLTGIAAAALVQLLTRSVAWAMIAFGIVMLSPEIGIAAGNVRMDSLTLAFELSGMSAFMWGVTRPGRALPGGVIAGALWGAAILTTQRAFPFGAAVAAVTAVALLVGAPFNRRSLALASAMVGTMVLAAAALWAHHWGVTPFEWLRRVAGGNGANPMVAVGLSKQWDASLTSVLTSVLVAPAAAIALFGAMRRESPAAASSRFVLAISVLAAVLTIAATNRVFLRSIYFVLLPLVATLSLGSALENGRARRAFLTLGACGLMLFIGVRAVKTFDTFDTWSARSPAAFDRLVADHVPRGSTVIGYDEFYLYAVLSHGSSFRSYQAELWGDEFAPMLAAWSDRLRRPSHADAPADFLLWPDGPPWTMPQHLACASRLPVARYDAPPTRSLLDRVPGYRRLASPLRLYPSTVLYRVPEGCSI